MDDATIIAILTFATALLPFAVAGILWLEKKLRAILVKYGIAGDQGDILYAMGLMLLAVIKEKVKGDPTKLAALKAAEDIVLKMKATWEDEAGTTEMLNGYLAQLQVILKEI